jgi:hypothetical protein
MVAIIKNAKINGTVEIARSFSYKLNCGNYESRDFFCSQKAECSAEDAEAISDALHAFCKRQVMQAVTEYQASQEAAQRVRRVG